MKFKKILKYMCDNTNIIIFTSSTGCVFKGKIIDIPPELIEKKLSGKSLIPISYTNEKVNGAFLYIYLK